MKYDFERAGRVINFFEKVLRHPRERYSPFLLIEWEMDFIRRVFGYVDDAGLRTVKRSYLEVGKKNGKSEFAAGIALYMLAMDGEAAAEVYLAATTKEQASIVFRTAASMIQAAPDLSKRYKVLRSTKTIVSRTDPNNFLRALAADGDTQDGINPHCVIVDELHRWKTGKSRELLDVLVKGTIARTQPLVFEITTAGSTEDESPLASLEHDRVRSIEAGEFSDSSFYGKIYAADPHDDWTLPTTWAKANPSLSTHPGGFLKLSAMEAMCTEAVNQPTKQPAFKRYHLGLWLSSETEWMDPEVWKKNNAARHSLVERPCYLGLDLSERIDLTSMVAVFPDQGDDDREPDGSFDVLPFFWMAQERVRERELGDRVAYSQWVREGLLEASSGNVIDLRDIKKKIEWACEVFDVRELAFDPHHALQLSIELTEELGISCVPVPQRYSHLSEPMKKLQELALQGKFRHEGNKILAWNMRCLRAKSDGADNVKPVKPDRLKSSKRIDGAVALVLALSRAIFHRGSVYESRGLVTT